jgi:predicted Zn-dependent protease
VNRFLPAVALSALLAACSTVSETGRSRIAFLPDSVMNSLGAQAYAESTSQHPVITGTVEAQMVERIGQRIAKASGRDYQWEFKLLDAPNVVNAFALPGGKVAVYSGLLKVTQNEDALAAVMGHEVAHATSGHGNERMSQGVISQIGMAGIELALSNWKGASTESKAQIMTAIGAGAEYGVILPFSRKHETEADEIGLRFLIRAGYDPNEAPKLWERMAQLGGGQRPAEFTSTHPDPLNRAKRLRELIPRFVEEERANVLPR